MDFKTKRAICLLVGIASILTIIGTVSYAYFTVLGETQAQEATISTETTASAKIIVVVQQKILEGHYL